MQRALANCQRNVITKLLVFTAAMFILPIVSYFLTRDRLFSGACKHSLNDTGVAHVFVGNAAYAGGFAAFVANVVLIGYIIVAFLDDKEEQQEAMQKKQR